MPVASDAARRGVRDKVVTEPLHSWSMFVADPPQDLRHGVPLAPLTTLGVGGPAQFFAEARSVAELHDLLAWARSRSVEVFVLGGGSNVVVGDAGFDGLVVKMAIRGVEFANHGARVVVRVAAGEPWDELVETCVARGLTGIECLSGIPGLAGAAPIQNVGAYGQEVSETIVAVEAVSRETGDRATFTNAECGFSYRGSVFKGALRDLWVVTAVTFSLERNRQSAIRYAELERALADLDAPSLSDVRRAVIGLRRAKGMVIDPSDPDTRSVGSFFMNPVVDPPTFDELARRAATLGISRDTIPAFPAGDRMKLSAAWLIERAGFARGTRRGAVALSSKHSLAIVNRGEATASVIRKFAQEIQDRVQEVFGVRLEPEAAFIGC